ncbi:DUF2318 domain-containing protein [Candidatus Microgenomates bacterium]|nr:DUF2318 domain-containing protein [Candidatus Microgenomates bacterium]
MDNKGQFKIDSKKIVIFLGVVILILAAFLKTINKAGPNNPAGVLGEKNPSNSPIAVNDGFLGDKGDTVSAQGDTVYIAESKVSDGNLHAFNYYSEDFKKSLYFFVVKASDGTYRAAANACEVCYGAKTGFKQVNDKIRCENCRNTYSKDQIALQKGGCNPRPIDKDVEVIDGQLTINLSDLEKTADLF